MCTSISYRRQNHYFGRNLDVEFSFNEKIAITPRNRCFELRHKGKYYTEYAMIGVAAIIDNYPLYYDAVNEKGLAMAGLNFPKNAVYQDIKEGKDNIAVFEFIPWILGQASDVNEAVNLLKKVNLVNTPYSPGLSSTPLHYMISDKEKSVVVEPMESGLKIFDNPYDVMTNNPPFEYHLWNMQNYINLNPANGENKFSKEYSLENYAVGMGSIGLPGDTSSSSRFIRAAFNLTNSSCDDDEISNVTQFFHVLDSVAMVQGSTLTDDGKNDITLYSCCINADKGIYYYKTYTNNQINAVSMNAVDLDDSQKLYVYELDKNQNIKYVN